MLDRCRRKGCGPHAGCLTLQGHVHCKVTHTHAQGQLPLSEMLPQHGLLWCQSICPVFLEVKEMSYGLGKLTGETSKEQGLRVTAFLVLLVFAESGV